MLTDTELAKLIINWKSQTGTSIRGRMCVPNDTAMRVNMYKDLVRTLVDLHQYTEEDLLAYKTQKMVIDASHNPKSPGKDTWVRLATEDWHLVVADEFPMQVLSHDPSTTDISRRTVNPPIAPKLQPRQEMENRTSKGYSENFELENPFDPNMDTGIPDAAYEMDESLIEALIRGSDE